MHQPTACTIASNNYLPYARVFTRSFLEHHPEGKVWTLVVDEPDPSIDYRAEPFEVVFANELGIPSFLNLAFRYSILELNTAVKPYFLEFLFRRCSCRSVCYFDPDILVTWSLEPLYRALEEHDVVLTPHVLQPVEDDGSPGERDFLLSGIFNLGFLGISYSGKTSSFLTWWQERLHRACVHRVDQGLFVDQKWMDFAPAFLDRVQVLRDPGYNVAYWNLVHRRVGRDADGFRVGDRPLRFFHFSGFQVETIDAVSKYQDRFTLDDRPDVRPLFERYREELLREGARELRDLSYAYGSFSNGLSVPPIVRRILQRLDPTGELWTDPFDAEARGSYYEWLTETVKSTSRVHVPRIALALWDERPDLQGAFPSPLGEDDVEFASWFAAEAKRSPELGAEFAVNTMESLAGAGRRRSPAPRRPRYDVLARVLARVGPWSWSIGPGLARWWNSRADFGVGGAPRVTRLAMMIHRRRADLQATFPDPLGTSREEFALWFVTYGRLEYSLPRRAVASVLRTLRLRQGLYARLWWLRHGRRRRAEDLLGGGDRLPREAVRRPASAAGRRTKPPAEADRPSAVNVVGWSSSPTGVGEACRGNLSALEAADVPHSLIDLNHPELDPDKPLLRTGRTSIDPRSPVLLFHVNADMMPTVRQQIPRALLDGKRVVGYWFWELAHFPLALADSFQAVDEVWAPTRFCQQAFAALAPCEVRWVPPGVRPGAPAAFDRFDLEIPRDTFLFFFAFDALSVPERKNPIGLLEAFTRVVQELGPRRVHLLVKVSHTGGNPGLMRRLRRLARKLPVTFLDKAVDRNTLQGLFGASDAYVSLHRSEGLGLPLIEAMFLGKPVVATAYGGCTDFLDESTCWPVRYSIESLSKAHGPYPAGTVWAAPDVEDAAAQMIDVVTSSDLREDRVRAARQKVESLYGLESAGERLRAELDRIEGAGRSVEHARGRRRLVS